MEIWKPINGFEGLYEISSLGRVKSLARTKISKHGGITKMDERILKVPNVKYPHINLHLHAKKHLRLIHRLVAKAFIPNPENKPEVNHINGNTMDYRIENLEWVTKSENQKHAYRTFLIHPKKGEDNEQCILSDNDVLQIRNKYKTGQYTTRKLGKEFGVSCAYISMIINNKNR